MNSPKVFAIILNYNSKETIKECVASVFKSDYPKLEIVIVDNDSRDGSFEAAKNFFPKGYFIKNEKNLGFAAGVNMGIRFALEKFTEYVFLLNPDATVEKNTISQLVAAAAQNEKAGISSPVVYNSGKGGVWFSGGKINWFTMGAEHNQSEPKNKSYFTGYVSGCAMLIKREVFKKIGLFDENLFLYYEDADFCVRARKAGFECLVAPEAKTYHWEKSETRKNEKIYWLVLSGLIFFRKNAPLFLKPWIFFYMIARKIKNKINALNKENETAKVVSKAYKDYEAFHHYR